MNSPTKVVVLIMVKSFGHDIQDMTNSEHINILINSKPFKAPKTPMTGREIKELGGGPVEYLLVEVVKDPDPVAGGDDKIINDSDSVNLKSGMRFRIVNPATFG